MSLFWWGIYPERHRRAEPPVWTTTFTPVAHQKCPVCEGSGLVPAGFYHNFYGSTGPVVCRRCQGLGTIGLAEENKSSD